MTDLVISHYIDTDLVALSVIDDDAALPSDTRLIDAAEVDAVEEAAAEALADGVTEPDLDALVARARELTAQQRPIA